MQLPRYPVSRTKTQELSRAAASAITPAEAANAAMAKYGGIASLAGTIGEVAQGISEIKSDQEATDGVITVQSELAKLDNELANMPSDIDENGKASFNAEEAIKLARKRQNEIINKARESIATPLGRKTFDRNARAISIRREGRTAAILYAREGELVTQTALDNLQAMVDKNDYEGALAYNDKILEIASIGLKQHSANEIGIMKSYAAFNKRGDEDYVYTELNDLDTTPADLQEVLVNLANGTRGDGTPLSIEEKDKNILMGKLRTKMKTFEEDKDDAKKQVERTAFFELYRLGLNGKLDLDDVEQTANQIGGFNAGYEKILRDMATGTITENFSSADDLKFFRGSVDNLKYMVISDDMNWKEEADNLLVDIHLSNLSHKDKQHFSKLVTDDINALDDDRSKLVARKVYVDLVGFDEGMIQSMNLSGEYDDKVSMAMSAKIALLDELERSGTSDGLLDWWEGTPAQPGMKQRFRAELNSETIQKVMDKPVTFPLDGKIDEEWRGEVVASMKTWYKTPSPDSTQAERESDIDSAITKFRKLTGIQLTDPVVRPIEVKQ